MKRLLTSRSKKSPNPSLKREGSNLSEDGAIEQRPYGLKVLVEGVNPTVE